MTKKSRGAAAAAAEEEEDEDDLTADLDDPTPENSINEVKYTAANAGRNDMQPGRPGGSTIMDVDEAQESQEGDTADTADTAGGLEPKEEDNVTEQTHHIIVPSYRQVET